MNNSHKINVIVFGMTANPGGMESVIMNYYRHIDRRKIHFDFLTNEPNIAYETELINSGSQIFKITARSKSPAKYHSDLKAFFDEHAKKYDAIWVNACSLANIDYLKMAKRYDIPCRIIHCHNSQNGDPLLRRILHIINRCLVARYATEFWTCDNDSNEWFYGKKVSKRNNIVVINNAIDPKVFRYNIESRNKLRQKLGLEKRFIIGNVGRFHFQKNQLFLLDIFRAIKNEDPSAFLVLVGQGGDEDKILNKIQQLSLKDDVMILQNRDDVSDLLNAFDVFLFPSLFEGFGLALLEAEAADLPAVASARVIPKAAIVSPNVTLVSLNEDASKWANATIKYRNAKRSSDNSFIEKSGFDITVEAAKMASLIEKGVKR